MRKYMFNSVWMVLFLGLVSVVVTLPSASFAQGCPTNQEIFDQWDADGLSNSEQLQRWSRYDDPSETTVIWNFPENPRVGQLVWVQVSITNNCPNIKLYGLTEILRPVIPGTTTIGDSCNNSSGQCGGLSSPLLRRTNSFEIEPVGFSFTRDAIEPGQTVTMRFQYEALEAGDFEWYGWIETTRDVVNSRNAVKVKRGPSNLISARVVDSDLIGGIFRVDGGSTTVAEGSSHDLRLRAQNIGDEDLTNLTLDSLETETLSGNAMATFDSVPGFAGNLSPGGLDFIDFPATFSGAGEVELTANLAARKPDGTWETATITRTFTVLSRPLTVTVVPIPDKFVLHQNDNNNRTTVTVTIKNNRSPEIGNENTINNITVNGGADGLIITSLLPDPAVPVNVISFTPPISPVPPATAIPPVSLDAGETTQFIWIVEAFDAPGKMALKVVVNGNDGGETITATGSGELNVIDDLLLSWGMKAQNSSIVSGGFARLDGFLKNETKEDEEPRDLIVLIHNELVGNLGGGYAFTDGEPIPTAYKIFTLEPEETVRFRALARSIRATVDTTGKASYGVRLWVVDENGKVENADSQAKLATEGEFTEKSFDFSIAENTIPPQNPFLDCGLPVPFCAVIVGSENLWHSITGLGVFLGTSVVDVGNYGLRYHAWKAWVIKNAMQAVLGDETALNALTTEIVIDIEALVDAGKITFDQSVGITTAVKTGIVESFDQFIRTVHEGNLRELTFQFTRLAVENIDLVFETLVATKAMVKLARQIPDTNSTIGQAISRQEARLADSQAERLARAAADGVPLERAFVAGERLTVEVLEKIYGVSKAQVDELRRIAKDENVVITFRARSPKSLEHIVNNKAWPKPELIKFKTVNQIDIDYLGYRPGSKAIVEVVEPPSGFRDFEVDVEGTIVDNVALNNQLDLYMQSLRSNDSSLSDPVLFAEVRGRLKTRVKEWYKYGPALDKAVAEKLPLNFNLDAQFPNGTTYVNGANDVRKVTKTKVEGPVPDSTRRYFEVKMSGPDGDITNLRSLTGDVDFLAILNPDGTFIREVAKRIAIYKKLSGGLLDMQHGESYAFFDEIARREFLGCCVEGKNAMAVMGPDGTPRAGYFVENHSVLKGGSNADRRLNDPSGDYILIWGMEFRTKTTLGVIGRLAARTLDEAYRRFVVRFLFWLPRYVHQQLTGDDGGQAEFSRDPDAPILQATNNGTGFRVWTPQNGWQPISIGEAIELGGPGIADMAPMTSMPLGASSGDTQVEITEQDELGATGPFFQSGDLVVINPGGDNQEFAIVQGLGSMIFTAPLQFDHNAGEAIMLVTGDINTVKLSPETAVCTVGQEHTVTATVKDESDEPLEGVDVSFEVLEGPNKGENGTDTTDSSGLAAFTYTGSEAGTDFIGASIVDIYDRTVFSNEVTKTWEEVPLSINDHVTLVPLRNTFSATGDTPGCGDGFAGTFSFDARLTNISSRSLRNVMIEIAGLTDGNLFQNADGGPAGEGAWLTVEETGEYSDGILGAGEYTDVHFILCLKGFASLTFFVDLFGEVE